MTGEAWLLLHVGALGDLVLAIQFARAVVADERLLVVSRTDPGDLRGVLPGIERRAIEGLGSEWLYRDDDSPPPGALARLVARRRVLSMLGGADAAVTRRLCMLAPQLLLAIDPRPIDGDRRHITEQWGARASIRLPVGEGLGAGVAGGDGAVLLHPGSGGRAKCWPLAGFVAVAEALEAAGREVQFIVGPAEVERWGAATIDALAARWRCHRAPSPDALVGLLAAAAGFVGNDAGPTHLAALIGVRTVALYGPTDPGVWGQLGACVGVVRGDPASAGGLWGLDPQEIAMRLRTQPSR